MTIRHHSSHKANRMFDFGQGLQIDGTAIGAFKKEKKKSTQLHFSEPVQDWLVHASAWQVQPYSYSHTQEDLRAGRMERARLVFS